MTDALIWLDIPGFPGYQASELGQIRSLDRRVFQAASRRTKECWLMRPGRVLRPAPRRSGHLSVVLGRGNTKSVHTLVALAFHGARPPNGEVLHLNHTPSDNRPDNIRWGTRSENLIMDYDRGVGRRHKRGAR